MRRRVCLVPAASFLLALVALGCDSAPLGPTPSPVASTSRAEAAARSEVPVFSQIVDVNPCTGEPITITYTGTGTVVGGGDNVIVQARGDVTTSDGYTGTFNWTFVFIPDHVTHFRTHDAELNADTGERIVFAVGLDHVTWKDGEAVVEFDHTTGARCVG